MKGALPYHELVLNVIYWLVFRLPMRVLNSSFGIRSNYVRHTDYIHWNPVKHGRAKQVKDWPYSSFHKHVDQGVYPLDWACDMDESDNYGE